MSNFALLWAPRSEYGSDATIEFDPSDFSVSLKRSLWLRHQDASFLGGLNEGAASHKGDGVTVKDRKANLAGHHRLLTVRDGPVVDQYVKRMGHPSHDVNDVPA